MQSRSPKEALARRLKSTQLAAQMLSVPFNAVANAGSTKPLREANNKMESSDSSSGSGSGSLEMRLDRFATKTQQSPCWTASVQKDELMEMGHKEGGRAIGKEAGPLGRRQGHWEEGKAIGKEAGPLGRRQGYWKGGRAIGKKAGPLGRRQGHWEGGQDLLEVVTSGIEAGPRDHVGDLMRHTHRGNEITNLGTEYGTERIRTCKPDAQSQQRRAGSSWVWDSSYTPKWRRVHAGEKRHLLSCLFISCEDFT
ncbi:hypothetical protein EYF80_011223 [Liparis tanakae]|uniref:Uncharacterized protein n=1 Tax=Liparis tanakae TaxID=230148 RepID=A0A4Z2ILM8_9TELE|nr:hypothetical protein EYF80_011223 [Liparis tanakae]